MADKRISQLVDRGTVVNNDVIPIVVSGAVTTNKATISSIQTFMQGNLDVGVTSVGITLGSTGTDVNVSGSPVTSSGNITINIPSASATNRGLVTTGSQTIAGIKSFDSTLVINQDIQLVTQGTALNTFIKNINGTGLTSIGSNGFGFNNSNNIYFSGSSKGGGIIAFNNTGNQTYTLQDASGTLAFTSDLTGFVTLATTQTITAQKTFTTSGGSDSVIITTTGAGFALDAIKAGNGEVIRVNKTSGTGNAMTVIGGNFEAPTIVKTGGTSSQFLMADGSVNTSVLASGAYLPLAGGTLTGALNGTSATFSSTVSATQYTATSTAGSGLRVYGGSGTNQWDVYLNSTNLRISDNTGTGSIVFDRPLSGTSATFSSTIAASGRISTSHSTSGDYAAVFYNTSATGEGVTIRGGSTSSHNALIVQPYNGATTLFSILATGAATFSGSVTATSFSAVSSNPFIIINDTSGGAAGQLQFQNNGTQKWNFATQATSNDLGLYNNGGTNSFNLYIKHSTGNVGIGTASPTTFSGNTTVSINNAAGGAVLELQSNGTSALRLGCSTSDAALWEPRSVPVLFGTANTERMRITSGGYVKASTNGSTAISLTANYHEFIQNVVGNTNTYFYSTGATQTGAIIIPVADRSNSSAYSFLTALSSGGGDTEFILRGDGNAFADGTWTGGGADYAEYFEWLDGNIENEDRKGYSVSLINDKIKIAEEGDTIIGVISGNASVIGDSAWNMWNQKYLRDDFQTYIRDENGDRILNPNYDPDSEYIPREKRPEWGVVGLVGKLCIIKGQPTMPNWIKLKNISDDVEQWLIK